MDCFVIMPFAQEFDDVYQVIKSCAKNALPDQEIICTRLDDLKNSSKISDDMVDHIQHSSLCIADVTGSNPNVMWEVGYAMALGKPLVIVTQNVSELPFDIRDIRVNTYSRASLSKTLSDPVAEAIRATLGERKSFANTYKENSSRSQRQFSIAVTGSMNADPVKCRRRIELLLSVHLNKLTTWYCGSYGAVDQAVIEFLLHHNQSINVVAYHAYDVSPAISKLIIENGIDFIDASKEQIPIVEDSPSERDAIYITKTDLLIALWDGRSEGTQELVQWYQSHKKDVLVGFV